MVEKFEEENKDNKNKIIVTSLIVLAAFLIFITEIFGLITLAKNIPANLQNKNEKITEQKTTSQLESDWQSYMKNMQKKIKDCWTPPLNTDSTRVVLLYSINKDGTLQNNYKVLVSSGNKQLDNSAIKALKKASPFKPLPKDFKGDHIDVQFTFDYNVYDKNIKNIQKI